MMTILCVWTRGIFKTFWVAFWHVKYPISCIRLKHPHFPFQPSLSLLLLDSHTFWAKNESYCNVMIRIEQNLSSHHGFFLFFALKLTLKLFWETFLGVKVDPCRHVFLHHFLNNKIEKKKVEWTVSRHRRCLERKLCFNTSFFHLPILFFFFYVVVIAVNAILLSLTQHTALSVHVWKIILPIFILLTTRLRSLSIGMFFLR